MADPRTFRVSVEDGRRLNVVEYGPHRDERTPLLCLPGLVRNARDFSRLAERTAETRRVICPDYRGRGLSEREGDWRRYSPWKDLRDMLHVRAARHIDRAIVVGTSFGGVLAMAIGASVPTILAGVVLNDIGPDPSQAALDDIVGAIARDRVIGSLDDAPDTILSIFPTLRFQTPELLTLMARNSFRERADGAIGIDWDPGIGKALLASPSTVPLWPLYGTLRRVPTLAFRGAESNVLSRECFERMQQEKPDLIRVEVPGTGHAPTLEEPEARTALDDFLADL